MEFSDIIKSRRSIRKFKPDSVPREQVEAVLSEALDYSPSACHKQPWRLLVISQAELKRQVVDCCKRNQFMQDAPYVIVGLADHLNCYEFNGSYLRSDVMDFSIVFYQLMLSAANKGLATCWIGSFESDKLEALLGIRYPWRIMGLTPLGQAEQEGIYRPRKSHSETLLWIEEL